MHFLGYRGRNWMHCKGPLFDDTASVSMKDVAYAFSGSTQFKSVTCDSRASVPS